MYLKIKICLGISLSQIKIVLCILIIDVMDCNAEDMIDFIKENKDKIQIE